MVPYSVPGTVHRTLGSDWSGTGCTWIWVLAHPAFSNIHRSAARRWSRDCGAFCTRSWTTDLSMRRKVTLSAKQALVRTHTAARLDHRSISIRPDAMRLAQEWCYQMHNPRNHSKIAACEGIKTRTRRITGPSMFRLVAI